MIANDETLQQASEHLVHHDPILAPVIARAGLPTLRPHTNYYQELVESIISQQLSVKAAASILKKFLALFDGTFPTADKILSKDIDTLRTAGLSRSKATYIRDLAQHVMDRSLRFDHLDELSNDEVIAELTAVKGVGVWTAHMFMMFCMGRLDVLAYGDLGIKNGMRKLYGLKTQPDAAAVQRIAKQYHWHPYESAACWYIWHSLDNKPSPRLSDNGKLMRPIYDAGSPKPSYLRGANACPARTARALAIPSRNAAIAGGLTLSGNCSSAC